MDRKSTAKAFGRSTRRLGVALRPFIEGEADSVLRSIMQSVDYGVLLTDLKHTSLACNARFGELFGIDIEDVVKADPSTVRAFVNSRLADPIAWRQNLREVYADPNSIQEDILELRFPTTILERYTCPVVNEAGEPSGRLWTFRDVTRRNRRKVMQEILYETSVMFHPSPEVVYDAIVERIGEFYNSISILSIRKQDFMEFASVGGPNPVAREMPGNSLAESYCQFCLEADGPITIQDSSTDPKYADVLPARLGLTRYAGTPLLSPDREIIGTLCIIDDRSTEPFDEDDLWFLSLLAMRISNELERESQLRALERDLETAQSQLIQNEKLAIAGTLAASVAHDIRNIVSAVTLDLGFAGDSDAEAFQSVRTHLSRFNVLAHRLLSYAQPKSAHVGSVSILETMRRVEELLEPQLQIASISMTTDLPDNLPQVRGDAGRLEHLFVNLTMNAIQAMKRRGEISVSAHQEADRVALTFQDNGPGIPADLIETLFEPFTTSRNDGFGLGLYSCRQIVRESGGEIHVTSAPGLGTAFHISLPVG